MIPDLRLPDYVPEQVAQYRDGHLMTHVVCRFDPVRAVDQLSRRRPAIAIDLGGDKLRWATYGFDAGILTRHDEQVFRSTRGQGYLGLLVDLARRVTAEDLPVGISSATKLDGSLIQRTVNLPIFFDEITRRYDADYRNLFQGRMAVVNDTIAGIAGASTRLALDHWAARDIAFFICGSGMGASVIKDGVAIHVEAAHVPLVAALNPLGQTASCGVADRDYVCVERVTAARAGIEDLYRRLTGDSLDGVQLAAGYEQGDWLASMLYETSALALAHAVAGVMDRYAFATEACAVVFHGGNFEIPRYRDALVRNLGRMPRQAGNLVFSRDLSENVCLDGAAILAGYVEPDDDSESTAFAP